MPESGRLRVCIITDAYLPGVGGIENHTFSLAAELDRLGHDVLVVTHGVPERAPQMAGQVRSPVPVERLPGRLLVYRGHDIALDVRMLAGFGRVLDRRTFDVVHGQSEGSALVYGALAAARRRGLVTVLTRHSVLSAKPAATWPVVMPVAWLLCRYAQGIIGVSRACAAETRWFPGPVRVIPNAVDTERFRPEPDVRRRMREQLGYSPRDIVFGYLGRLHNSKGIPLLLAAFERLRQQHPDCRLLLAGPGPLRSEVTKSAGHRSGTVRLLDAVPYDRVPAVLNAMDAFAFPSRGEAFGIALLEAMACGLPAVAFGRWGVLDVATDGETAFLVREPGEFGARLAALAQDEVLRRRMGDAARLRAARDFSWPRVAEETVAFYRELLARQQDGTAAGAGQKGRREPIA